VIDWINGALAALAASISVDNPAGLAAIFLLAMSADIGIPFPFVLDTILFFTTYTVGALSLPVLLIVSMLLGGRVLGTGILYWVSRILGPRFTDWICKRSRFLGRNIEGFQSRLGKWPMLVIIGARLTPGLMQLSSVGAGILRVPYYQVVVAIVFSSIVYDGTLVALGTLARLGLQDVGPEYSFWIVLGLAAIMTLVFVAVYLIRRRVNKASTAREH